jgi:hypothetical protein
VLDLLVHIIDQLLQLLLALLCYFFHLIFNIYPLELTLGELLIQENSHQQVCV